MSEDPLLELRKKAVLSFSQSDKEGFLSSFHSLMHYDKSMLSLQSSVEVLRNACALPHAISPEFISAILEDFKHHAEDYTVNVAFFMMEMSKFLSAYPEYEKKIWQAASQSAHLPLHVPDYIPYHVLSKTQLSLKEIVPVLSSIAWGNVNPLFFLCHRYSLAPHLHDEFLSSFRDVFSLPWREKDKVEAFRQVLLPSSDREMLNDMCKSLEERINFDLLSPLDYRELSMASVILGYTLSRPCPFVSPDENRLAMFMAKNPECFDLPSGFSLWMENSKDTVSGIHGFDRHVVRNAQKIWSDVFDEIFKVPRGQSFSEHIAQHRTFAKMFLKNFKNHPWFHHKILDCAKKGNGTKAPAIMTRDSWLALLPSIDKETRILVLSNFLLLAGAKAVQNKTSICDFADSLPLDDIMSLETKNDLFDESTKKWWRNYCVLRSRKELKRGVPHVVATAPTSRKM